jgi:membrane-bound lytic murein transglycosylase D
MNQLSGDRIRVGATMLVPTGSASPQYAGTPARRKVSPAASAPKTTYRVRRGDTLWNISQKFDVSLSELRAWNGLSRRDGIQAGQRLVLQPKPESSARVRTVDLTNEPASAIRPKRLTYRVKRGDTLWGLSKNFNVPISDIRKWNGLGRKGSIRTGQRLVLYVNAEQS